MDASLREVLTGFDASVISTLASNDVRSLDDAKLLSVDDLKELGFSLGVRNRLLKTIADANFNPLLAVKGSFEKTSGSMKNLLDSGLSALGISPGIPTDLAKFKDTFDFGGEDAGSLQRRNVLYPCWDTNENGFLSLAETDQGIKVALIEALKSSKDGERIWKRFRKSYIRAFVDAADAAPQRTKKATTMKGGKRRVVSDDDYVTRREFRLLICYLSIYATMYELFALLDGRSEGITVDDDNRISRSEWDAGLPTIIRASESWAPFVALQGVTKATFDKVDTNKGGMITLTEFCEWIENAEKAAKTETGKLLGIGE